jgi:hypothetical protein
MPMLTALARRPLLSATGALLATAAIAGCGDDEEEAAEPKVVNVEVRETGRTARISAPRSVEAGAVTIRLRNSGRRRHEAQLVKVDGGQSADDVLRVIQNAERRGIPNWLHGAGGVGTTPPGVTGSSTQVLSEGSYYLFDTESGGRPATAALKVEGGGDGELPKAAGRVTARDYSFEASGLKSGKNTIVFDNAGREIHHLVAVRMRPGATIADVRRFLQTEKGRPPFVEEPNRQLSTPVLDGGTKQVTQLDFAPGKYAFLCFITDRRGGPPHVAKGMISETTVR